MMQVDDIRAVLAHAAFFLFQMKDRVAIIDEHRQETQQNVSVWVWL